MTEIPLREDARRWFGTVELAGAPAPACDVLRELLRMLDVLGPTLLDKSRSTVRAQGHGWTVPDSVEIQLAHATDEDASVSVVVGNDQAIISWAGAHEHVGLEDSTAERPWTTVVVDATAAVLRGEYEVENHYRGTRLVKTRVVDVKREATVSTTGTIVSSWLPWPRKTRVERQRLEYGVSDA